VCSSDLIIHNGVRKSISVCDTSPQRCYIQLQKYIDGVYHTRCQMLLTFKFIIPKGPLCLEKHRPVQSSLMAKYF
jgi:hypothetical protein